MKEKFKDSFRQPNFQGLFECWFVLLYLYIVGSYNNHWYQFLNSLACYIFGILRYFEAGIISLNIPPSLMFILYNGSCKIIKPLYIRLFLIREHLISISLLNFNIWTWIVCKIDPERTYFQWSLFLYLSDHSLPFLFN